MFNVKGPHSQQRLDPKAAASSTAFTALFLPARGWLCCWISRRAHPSVSWATTRFRTHMPRAVWRTRGTLDQSAHLPLCHRARYPAHDPGDP